MKILINHGANVEGKFTDRDIQYFGELTPLMAAIKKIDMESVKILLQYDADIEKIRLRRQPPLFFALKAYLLKLESFNTPWMMSYGNEEEEFFWPAGRVPSREEALELLTREEKRANLELYLLHILQLLLQNGADIDETVMVKDVLGFPYNTTIFAFAPSPKIYRLLLRARTVF